LLLTEVTLNYFWSGKSMFRKRNMHVIKTHLETVSFA